MSTIATIMAIILGILAMIALFYKIHLQIRILDPGKKGSLSDLAFRLPSIIDLLPMRIKYKPPGEIELRKRANKALAVFYICLICVLLLSLIME
ncbi:MAG TPA: hypothetical protein VHD83_20055 [Puia sp.]|nr:hypothetical protein [Puia sp.]